MAKKEKSSTSNKPKGTKRKHEPDEEEAVASKSVILSKEAEELPPKKQISQKLKLKHKSKGDTTDKVPDQIKSKKRKASDEDDEMREPTAEELRESEKPENTKAVVTVRQKKKQKHQQRLEVQKDQSSKNEVNRNEEYLQKWKNNKDEWKFEKLRQISIQLSVFDDTKISAEVWPIALEYLSGSKGAAKDKITKSAEKVIDELDKEAEKATDDADATFTLSEKYRRARELLQSFD